MKNTTISQITNGYYIVTALKRAEEMETRDKDYIAAGTVNWLTQVSFDPLQVAVSVGLFSDLNETIDKSQGFTVHVLRKDQQELIEKFAQKSDIQSTTINGISFSRTGEQAILDLPCTTIECKLKDSVRVGDHTMHIGEVQKMVDHEVEPISTVEHPTQYTPDKVSV